MKSDLYGLSRVGVGVLSNLCLRRANRLPEVPLDPKGPQKGAGEKDQTATTIVCKYRFLFSFCDRSICSVYAAVWLMDFGSVRIFIVFMSSILQLNDLIIWSTYMCFLMNYFNVIQN